MNKYLLVLLMLYMFIIQSCDPFYHAYIVNESGNNSTIAIYLNKDELESGLSGETEYLIYFAEENKKQLRTIDTVEFKVDYLLKPGETLNVSNNTSPTLFGIIKNIIIYNTDSSEVIYLDNENKMKAAFKEKGSLGFELKIK